MTKVNLKSILRGEISTISNPLLLHYILNAIYSPYIKYPVCTLNGQYVTVAFNEYSITLLSPTPTYLTEKQSNKILPYILEKYARSEITRLMRKYQTKSN